MAGVENILTGLIIRDEHSRMNAELKRRRPDVQWREQVMGREEKCSLILRGDTRSDVLRRRLEGLTKEIGIFG